MELQDDCIIYGECRCCLSKGNHRHITKEYTNEGVREVYIEMFLDCMNLFLVSDPRLPPLICDSCVSRLRDVRSFRALVIATEQQLLQAVNKDTVYVDEAVQGLPVKDVKTEQNDIQAESDASEDNKYKLKYELELKLSDGDEHFHDTEVKQEYEEIENEIINEKGETYDLHNHHKPRKRKRQSKVRTKKMKDSDSESDTPISEIKIKKQKNVSKSESKETPKKSKKESFKDNKNVRSNILLLLKNSTIIPFHNNFKMQYNCFYCEKFYTTFKELRGHMENLHTDESEATIEKCLRPNSVLIVSADISHIKCKICDAEFKNIEHLIEHLTKTHKKVFHETNRKPSHGILGYDLSSDLLKCHICSKEFAFFKNLTIHMNEHCSLFVCYMCGKKFLSEHRLQCHVFTHHQKEREPKCEHCSQVFKTESSLTYHIKKEHYKRTIKCPKCPLTFSFTQYISRMNHMATVHGIKKPVFKCETCQREYSNSGSLAAHKRNVHIRPNELRCEICGYITVHKSVMKNHVDMHNGVKNYECQFCKKKFGKPYTLKLHLKIHLNDKRFACSLCSAAFIQKNSLKSHLKTRHPDSGIDVSKL